MKLRIMGKMMVYILLPAIIGLFIVSGIARNTAEKTVNGLLEEAWNTHHHQICIQCCHVTEYHIEEL